MAREVFYSARGFAPCVPWARPMSVAPKAVLPVRRPLFEVTEMNCFDSNFQLAGWKRSWIFGRCPSVHLDRHVDGIGVGVSAEILAPLEGDKSAEETRLHTVDGKNSVSGPTLATLFPSLDRF